MGKVDITWGPRFLEAPKFHFVFLKRPFKTVLGALKWKKIYNISVLKSKKIFNSHGNRLAKMKIEKVAELN